MSSRTLSLSMQRLVKQLLLTIARGEKTIETQRQALAKILDFEPFAAFSRVDKDGDGFVTPVDLLHFLRYHYPIDISRDNGVDEANEADCYYIIKYFDSDDD